MTAWMFGDPHIQTLDGRTYTFNGHGEYILLKIEDTFQIQCRTQRATKKDGTLSEATVFSGCVVKTDDAWLQVEINANKSGIYLRAGDNKTSFDDYTEPFNTQGNSFNVLKDSFRLSRDNKTLVTSFSSSGIYA